MSEERPARVHTVFLVGAGPGDPGLITVRGARALAAADVIIADRLVATELLEGHRQGTELIVRGAHRRDLPQHEINRLLVEKARSGRRVVRLKGGDPFVFGRGGEEAEALRAAGVPFAVVPGVTAAIAAPACAGIPVTHRGLSGVVAFVTGHEADDKQGGQVDWEGLAKGAGTIVLYMSVTHLPAVVARLLDAGRSPSTPAAIIERGTTPRQRTITGTLADIVERARLADVRPPALTIVGEVVALRGGLSWFEERERRERRILVLDATADDAGDDPRDVVGRDAAVLAWDGVVVERAHVLHARLLFERLAPKLAGLDRHRWLVLTSARAVEALDLALQAARLDARALANMLVACVGEGTAGRLRRTLAIRADCVGDGGGDALARRMLATGAAGPVLFPRAAHGRDELPDALRTAGFSVEVVDAYEAHVDAREVARAVAAHRDRPFDAVAFRSPRVAAAFLDERPALGAALVGAIGETTARSLEARGVRVDVVASRPHTRTLVEELARALAARAPIK